MRRADLQITPRSSLLRRLAVTVATLGITLAVVLGARAQEVPESFKVEAPEFPEGLTWKQSKPLTLAALRGKVVLVDFWEYTCVNCIRTFPYLKDWHEKYKDKGLVIVGVHTPEFHFAKSEGNVMKAAKDFGLGWPMVIDSDYQVWRTYGNRYWPAKYLIDHEGFVRYFHFGEGAYASTEARIQKLLKEANPKVELPPIGDAIRGTDKPGAVCYPVTPELYLGAERGGHAGTLANREGYRPGSVVSYKDPGNWEDGLVYANGEWKNTDEALISVRKSPHPRDYIAIKYHALEVNSVIRPENGKPVRVWVYHDGKPIAKKDAGEDIKFDGKGRSYMIIDEPRMYHIVKNAAFAQRTLKLATAEPGLGIYSFTFVSCELPSTEK